MLIIFRPFKAGDFIEAAGTSGTVIAVNNSITLLRTGDNRDIIVPNSRIYGGIIINVTARDTRRIDMVFGIGYDDDIRTAKRLITKAMQQDALILSEPAPAISIAELADSSVNLNVPPWTKTADYRAERSDLLENIKAAFEPTASLIRNAMCICTRQAMQPDQHSAVMPFFSDALANEFSILSGIP